MDVLVEVLQGEPEQAPGVQGDHQSSQIAPHSTIFLGIRCGMVCSSPARLHLLRCTILCCMPAQPGSWLYSGATSKAVAEVTELCLAL